MPRCGFLVLSLLSIAFPASWAGEATPLSPLDFGAIDLNPGGDTIVIAATNGPALPTGGRSVVTGGGSGLIALVANPGTEEHVDIGYPDTIPLACEGHQIFLNGISGYSQYASTDILLAEGGAPVQVSVGGVLVFQGNEIGCHYSGTMHLQLNFY